jgi:hypothetical protein
LHQGKASLEYPTGRNYVTIVSYEFPFVVDIWTDNYYSLTQGCGDGNRRHLGNEQGSLCSCLWVKVSNGEGPLTFGKPYLHDR